jgi:hypothetical protein
MPSTVSLPLAPEVEAMLMQMQVKRTLTKKGYMKRRRPGLTKVFFHLKTSFQIPYNRKRA